MIGKLLLLISSLYLIVNAQNRNPANVPSSGNGAGGILSGVNNIKSDSLNGRLGDIEQSCSETNAIVSKLARLKISGYLQSQFQVGETLGVQTSGAGAKFDRGSQSRFFVRRGHIKFNYDNGLSQYMLQFDGSSNGFEIKDAYVSITEPWLRYFTGAMGILDRPFGHEISYSSSKRESPERSRITQTLFPKDQEIGARLAFAPKSGPLSFVNITGGIFNGVTTLQIDNDTRKDVIGRIGLHLPLHHKRIELDGGFSGYYGKVTNTDTTAGIKTASRIDTSWSAIIDGIDSAGNVRWSTVRKFDTTYTGSNRGTAFTMDGNRFRQITGMLSQPFDRNYFGFDLQFFYDLPVVGRLTLRSEYLWGTQPGTLTSSSFYQPSVGGAPNGAVYSRNFTGYYLYWVQRWGDRVQSVVKYDAYDPNVDAKEDNIGEAGSFTSATDLSFATFGAGLIYDLNENLKFMLYYDMPRNEISRNLASADPYKNFSRDLPDNVFVVRVQFRF